MRYIVQHTNIVYEDKLYSSGDEVELPDDIAERLADYLRPVKEAVQGTRSKEQHKSVDREPSAVNRQKGGDNAEG